MRSHRIPATSTVSASPLRDGSFVFAGRRLAEGDDLRQMAVAPALERVTVRCQLGAVDARPDHLRCRLAQCVL
jgi:hypothetical protein